MLRDEVAAASDRFIAALAGVSPAQWSWKPDPDRWSVSETAEHTAVVLRGVQRLLATKLFEQPLPPRESAARATDDLVVRMMFDRSKRRPAPESVLPKGRWATPEALAGDFVAARDALLEWLAGVQYDLRSYGAPHPVMGTLDGVQWLLFVAAHTERHTRQIIEAKTAPGYPG
jgi:hypothetical protein